MEPAAAKPVGIPRELTRALVTPLSFTSWKSGTTKDSGKTIPLAMASALRTVVAYVASQLHSAGQQLPFGWV